MCHFRINPTLPKSRESKRTHTQNQQSGTRSSDALTYRIRFRCTHSPLPISVRRQVSNPRCVITSAFHTETRRNLSVTSLHGQRAPTPSHTSSLRASSVRARRSRQNTARRFTHRSCESMSPHPHEPRSLCSTPSSQPRAPRSADPRGRAEGDARPTRRAGERARQVEEARRRLEKCAQTELNSEHPPAPPAALWSLLLRPQPREACPPLTPPTSSLDKRDPFGRS